MMLWSTPHTRLEVICASPCSNLTYRRILVPYCGLPSASWEAFLAEHDPRSRLVLMTTSGSVALHSFAFAAEDTILLGRESAGAPEVVHRAAARVVIPLHRPARSLNVALAGAIALAEALRQTGLFPPQ